MYFAYFLLLILSIIGLVECIHQLGRFLSGKRRSGNTFIIVPASGTPPSLEFLLRDLQHDRLWDSPSPQQICVVDMGLSPEAIQMIRLFQKDMEGLCVCAEADLPALIKKNIA